jgi:hypothetical protein
MLRLDGPRIRGAIDERYGGSISRLASALTLEPPPDRSTVTRWLTSDGSHFPRNEERILALAGALDIDPTALWTFDTESFPVLWPKIVRAARSGKWSGLLNSLSFLRHFADATEQWPPQAVASRFFDRPWTQHDLVHDPAHGANYYRNVILRPTSRTEKFPRVWHFASRYIGGAPRRDWRPIGFVRREPDMVTLFSDFAMTEQCLCVPDSEEVCVQLWHGQGSEVFRIASLHPFDVSVVDQPRDDVPLVRFGFPGEVR